MLKPLFLLTGSLCFIIGCRTHSPAAAPRTLYGQRIVAATNLTGTATELVRWAEQMTGAKFEITQTATNPAIHLLLTNSPVAAATDVARLANKGQEAFVIRSDNADQLSIVGNSPAGLQHGVYFYLDQLGCRWFLPNDHWTIIPTRKSIGLRIDRVEVPAFRLRDFFGTGAFGRTLPIDPKQDDQRLQRQWEQWKTRNLLGGEIRVQGHSWESFNHLHKAILLAHPEYLAEIGGKRQPWATGTKFCVTNPGLRQLFVADRVGAYRYNREKWPGSPLTFAITVEPSDSGGFCQCAECAKLGSVGNQVFDLANEVARAVATNFPGGKVSVLGYGEHAGVPDFPLEPNVYVMLVPYGFQRTGLSGNELTEAWEQKTKPLGMYDYWAIPDWANCQPSHINARTVVDRIRFWHQHSVDAFLGESSYSAGNVGLLWYVAAKLFWNPATDANALIEEFYEKCFGPAAPPMRRMLERWHAEFMLNGHEMALSFRDVQEARSLATDPAIRARVDDYAMYLQYIHLWSAFKSATTNQAEATQTFLRYNWRIYDSAMVHSFRMHSLVRYRSANNDPKIYGDWEPASPAWKDLPPVTADEIDKFIAAGVQLYQPVVYEKRTYSTDLVQLTEPPPASSNNWLTSFQMVGGQELLFLAAPGVTSVEFQIRCGPRKSPAEAPYDRVSAFDPDDKRLVYEQITPDGGWHSVVVPTPAPGLYRVLVEDQKLSFSLRLPAHVPFTLHGGFTCSTMSTRAYFYVPKGLTQVALLAHGAGPIEVRDGNDKLVGEPANGFIIKAVPPGQDGKVWSVLKYKSYLPLRPLNVPPYFALSPQTLLVPAEVAPPASQPE